MSRPILIAASVAISASLALGALYIFDFSEPTNNTVVIEPTEKIPPAVSESNNKFAIDMYRKISAHSGSKDKNIFFSPFSMYLAFSLLYEGARTDTASQMEDVFGFEPDYMARHAHVINAMSYVNRDDQNTTLAVANALWLQERFEPAPGYTDIAHYPYLADMDTLGFYDAPAESVKRINSWVDNKTNGRITSVVSEPDMTPDLAMIINNAIYFNGTWVVPFYSIPDENFWTQQDADPIKVDFLRRTDAKYNYTESDGIRVLKLPYLGDRFSMLVFLPVNAHDTGHLEETISAENIDMWISKLAPKEVHVHMPKFTMQTGYNLRDYLSDLGMPSVFQDYADLSGIHPNLYVGHARHDAFIDVNEKGSEAAAVTSLLSLLTGERPYFVFDARSPFIFTILDEESKTILFMGRVSNPSL